MLQVAGNLAYYPDASGALTVADVRNGTNVSIVSVSPNLQDIGALALHGQYAFVTTTNEGLIAFDASVDPPAPVLGGRYVPTGPALDVRMNSIIAFVAEGVAGISVVDLFDVTAPMSLVRLSPDGEACALDLVSNRLYVACGGGGLAAYNVSNVSAVTWLGSRTTATPARRVRAAGTLAFVACDSGRLEILNIAAAPPTLLGTYQTSGSIADVDVAGSFALLANTNGTLLQVNVGNPAAPVLQSTHPVPGAAAVRVVGTNAYVRTSAGGLVVIPLTGLAAAAPQLQEGVNAILTSAGQAVALSVLVSGTPPLSFQWRKDGVALTNGGRFFGVTNAYLQIADVVPADSGNYSVTVINALGQLVSSNLLTVVNPGVPVLRGGFLEGGNALGLDAADFVAYVADGVNGLEMYDVVDPRYPRRTGGGDVAGESFAVRLLANNVWLATGTNGLQGFDVTMPQLPSLVAATNTAGFSRGVQTYGGLLYLADGPNGVQVFNPNTSPEPAWVGGFDTPGFAFDLCLANGLAYVADGTNGLQILSVTNPASLVSLGSYDTPGDVRNIRVVADKAYVAAGAGGLLVLNVANPAAPTLLGSYATAGPVLDLEVIGDTVILARSTNGIETVNAANPAAIVSLGVNLAATPANAVRLEGFRVYVAAGTNGVKILELAGLTAAYPAITVPPADAVALPGQTASFQVVATGAAPLTYQWFRAGIALTESAETHGVSTDTLTISNLQLSTTGEYAVVVRNGWNLSTYALASLAVVPVGTPVFRSGYFDSGDALNTHVVGQIAFVANRLGGLQAIDCRDPRNPVKIGENATAGLAQDVQVRGRYAYVACWDAGLQIFDVLNPTNLVPIGQCDTPGFARTVRVAGNRAYLAARQGGISSGGAFAVIDVTDPTRPTLAGMGATTGFAEGLEAAGDHVFVATSQGGLEVFNAADALAPVRIAQVDTPGSAESVTLVSNRLYLADYNRGLQILDVSNPAAPVKLGEFQTAGDAFHVQVVSNRAYVAEGIRRVEVVDVSNPALPVLISTGLAGDTVHGLNVVGDWALLADRQDGLVVSELLGFPALPPRILSFPTNLAAVANRELVLSVASEGSPPLSYQWFRNGTSLVATGNVSGVTGPHLRFQNFAATNAGSYTVVVASPYGSTTSGVAVVTVNAPGTPLARGVFDTPGNASAAVARGNFAFVADGAAGVRIVNLTNLDTPAAFSSYAPTGVVQGLTVQTNLLFLALGTDGIEIVNISNPAAPFRVGGYDTPGTALNVDVAGARAYVADGAAGLQILSVADPANPVFLGSFATTGTASDVRVLGNLAYVAAGAAGLRIIGVTNPAAPVLVGSFATPGNATAVRVAGNRAYLACGSGGVVVLDVQSPAVPVALGTNATVNALSLDVVGDLVIVADGSGGYRVLDATTPAAMVVVGSSAPGDAIRGAMLVGNLALLAGGTNGLRLVELAGVNPAPAAFLQQPAGISVLHGDTAQFRAALSGTPPLTCRWYFNGLPLFDGSNCVGAGTPELTVTNVALEDAGAYTLRVLNAAGVTNSAAAALTFIGPLQAQLNAAAPGAVINLTTGIYSETLTLDKDVTLTGPWWNKPVLDAGGVGPVLQVRPGVEATLRGIELRHGAGLTGGAVYNQGLLTLDACLIASSTAPQGGGIYNAQTLRLFSSVVSNNTAAASGGGIYNQTGATAWLTNTTITANTALEGGGILNAGTLTATNSLVASNLATGSIGNGGGICALTGAVLLARTTVSGNQAAPTLQSADTGLGGGVRVEGGSVAFWSATVADNTAAQHGGGLSIANAGAVSAFNSLFADNAAPVSPDYGGVMNSEGFNLVQHAAGTVVTGEGTGVLINLDARLGPLRDNGGPTHTHALLPDSPAIDAGADDEGITDQRGIAQPFDIPWFANTWDGADIGAFEFIDPSPYLVVSNRTASGFALVWSGSGALQWASSPNGPWTELTNASPVLVLTTNAAFFYRLRQAAVPAVLTTNSPTNGGFTLTWPVLGILEAAPSTSGPWRPLTGISPRAVSIQPGESEFFRLRVLDH